MTKERLINLAEVLNSAGFEILSFCESEEENLLCYDYITYDLKITRPIKEQSNPNKAENKK